MRSRQYQIAEDKSIPFNNFTGRYRQGAAEAGAVVDEGVKLAIFTAKIDGNGQFLKHFCIEIAAGEFPRQFDVESLRIDTGDLGLQPGGDHGPGETGGRDVPYREERLDAGAGELPF